MAVKFKSLAGKVSALALTISALALPAAAEAQQHGRRFRDNEAAGNVGGDNEARRAPRSAPSEDGDRSWSRPAQVAPRAAPADEDQQGRAAQAPGWNGGVRIWNDGRSVRQDDRQWRERDREVRRDEYRREEYRRDDDHRWDNRNDRQRYTASRDYRRWDNRWRDNRRYDWYSYRRTSPSTFRGGLYYAPYRNYSYRRLNIGFFLDSLFYSNRYWITDPWQYRLPDVYGPYRWVRYYDDALLVNTYTGEVADVIYAFFW
ncbi:MAG: RcnB family protein [Novosphingobium sp.]